MIIREIKFRAYNGEEMIILENSGLQYFDFEGSYSLGFTVDGYTEFWGHEQYDTATEKSNKFPLMQFTGLKDKNGTDIYDGDVLKILNGWNDNQYITNVRYESNVFCIDVQGFDYNVTPLGYLDEECIIEIIGNIHENPELLCTSQST